MRKLPQPNAALAEMMRGELDEHLFGVVGEFASTPEPRRAPMPQPLQIEPPDGLRNVD